MNEIESLIKRATKYVESAGLLLEFGAFGEHFIKTGVLPKEFGRELNRAFEKRQLGDYEYNFVISEDEAEIMLQNGKRFVDEIIKILKQIP